ncbi:MAG TPA: hypothetical protein DF613_13835, partial [Lachnospiraceae bacterium]|nr:hypothetical protein [Lachnospiraceae bacterium]
AGFVKKILQNDCSACFSHHPQDFDQTLLALSHNLIYSSQHLDALVKSCGWKQDDVYCCFKIFAVKDQMVGSLENACLRLEKIVDKSYAIIDEKYILFLVNLESCGKSCADVKAEMALHFRDFMLRAGISAEFRELKRLSQYYEQASIALAIGMKSDPTKWTYPFEQYALRYMARQCTELLDPKALCIPGLLRLMEYDRKKGRNYAQILRVYIDNNMNVAETTRKIFVQRATFLYQLKKIKEITGLNLKDPMTRFYLACSYYLLDFAGEGSEEV